MQDCQHKLQLAIVDKEYLQREVSSLGSRLHEQQTQVAALDESLAAEKAHSQELYRKLLAVRFRTHGCTAGSHSGGYGNGGHD